MKATTLFFASALFACLFSSSVFGQVEFKSQDLVVSNKTNDERLKQSFKAYKSYELNLAEIKTHIRKNKGDKTKPIEFTLTFGTDKVKMNLFENDIFDDAYFEVQNGVKKSKNQIEINSYAGFVGDDPANILRLFISDKRISGFFKYNGVDYVIRHLTDYGIVEKGNSNKFEILVAKSDDEDSKLKGMSCGNSKPNPNARLANACPTYDITNCGQMPTCKYLKLLVASDYEFFSKISGGSVNFTAANAQAIILDYINSVDAIMLRDLNLRLKLQSSPLVYTTPQSDPFPNTLPDGTPLYNVQKALALYGDASVFGSSLPNDIVRHYLSGWGFNSQYSSTYGQADQCGLNGYGNKKPQSISTVYKYTSNSLLSYQDSYLLIAHEIGHVIGTDHDCSSNTIMCDQLGKDTKYGGIAKAEINCFLANHGKSAIENNNVSSAFSNFLTVKLNGNNILNTPVFINKNAKIIDISNPPYEIKNGTTFSSNNPLVYFLHYKTTISTKFEIKTAPNFTLTIIASDKCNNYYRGIPFVYSPYGARKPAYESFPNPADEEITIRADDIDIENAGYIQQAILYNESGGLVKTIPLNDDKKDSQSLQVSDLKDGIYYLHLIDEAGSVIKKRIIIKHQ